MAKTIYLCILMLVATSNSFSQTVDTVCSPYYENTSQYGLDPQFLTVMGGNLYFAGNYATDVAEYLWKSNGTCAGSFPLKKIDLGVSGYNGHIVDITAVGNLLYFSDVATSTIWRSDGTAAGTYILMNGEKSPGFVEYNGKVYFGVNNPVASSGLWVTDGTVAGTTLVKQMKTAGNFTGFQSNLYFVGNDGITGNQLWRTDGTNSGTVLVRMVHLPTSNQTLNELMIVGSTLYFTCDDSTASGIKLWKTDGSSSGTIVVPTNKIGNYPRKLFAFNGKLFLNAWDPALQGITIGQLFVTDGTDAGTLLLKSLVYNIAQYTYTFNPYNFTIMNNNLYFMGSDSLNGNQIWKTDGTIGGTTLVTPFNSTKNIYAASFLKAFDNHLVFGGTANGIEGFYYSDGTFGDIHYQPPFISWRPDFGKGFTEYNGALYFNSNCSNLYDYELYKFYFALPNAVPAITKNNENSILVFPNPSTSQITISSVNTMDRIEIVNMLGQVVYSKYPEVKKLTAEIRNEGVYVVRIYSNNSIAIKKINIQR
ncbi:MAG: T9SS type A sorting domain-containing protein [Chitinophagaceae bacterium]